MHSVAQSSQVTQYRVGPASFFKYTYSKRAIAKVKIIYLRVFVKRPKSPWPSDHINNYSEHTLVKMLLLKGVFATISNFLIPVSLQTNVKDQTFQIVNFVKSNNLSLNYKQLQPSGCKDRRISL